ncbi:WRKY transcription factor 70 family protein [Tripterygium wilfordii]|uniref:WRKY transcription factor 70 family protein n=1 Tax=Tripterygium wilfordii TaxID=458696 RepID=A0A7J7E279_TRIWF|nr:WRKY DNA-binding transcription factor 70-like [Tripterygium wilfordii]KAF5752633.1 WRKY transcription factor 70 family protein [Tripterygium wilfordii]
MGTSSWKQRVMKELVDGQESATQLQVLLQKPFSENGSSQFTSVDEHLVKILGSFTESLSLLMMMGSNSNSSESDNNNSQVGSGLVCCDHGSRRSDEDCTESKKRVAVPSLKDRRGCYKRKQNSQSWTIVSSTVEDIYAWRKYGQKDILNAKYPRSYFRCTHKYDKGCKATKQVQKMEDQPGMFQTTYIGNHTCRNVVKAPPMIKTDPESCWESCVVIPESKIATTIKQEPSSMAAAEETPSSTGGGDDDLNNSLWKDLMPYEYSCEPASIVSHVYTSYTDVTSQDGLDIDFGVDSVNFDTYFTV